MRLRPIENPCPDWNKHSRWADRPSQSWNCISGLVLIPWGMQLSIWCHFAILVSLFLSIFRLIIRSVSWISFSFHAHLRRTAKLNCLSLRRWTTLAMPGWQATRWAHWMGTPTRARMTSSWWNSMPRVSTCGRASAVVRAVTMLTPFRRTGCDVVFLAISCDIFHGAKTSELFRGSMFRVMGSGITIEMDQSLVCFYKGLISRISWSVSWKSERWILTKSTEWDHALHAWNLELTKALDDEYFTMCKFLLERCHARKNQTLESLYVLIYWNWFEISWFKWVSSWHSGAWRCSMFFIVFAFAMI